MARTTQQIRDAWRPACSPRPVSVLPALEALDQVFQAHGYRPKAGQTWGYNCLGFETEVVTWEGVRPIGKLVGPQRLMTTRGQWVDAEVRSFGRQPLATVTLRRNGVDMDIKATSDHRWLVTQDGRKSGRTNYNVQPRTTDQLRVGDRMACAFRRSVFANTPSLQPSPFGIAHGFVFGDGTRTRGSAIAYFIGEKDEALRDYFPKSSGRRASGLPFFFKEPPSINEAPAYVLGWLAGYFAADGRVTKEGVVEISSAVRENIEAVERVCLRLGIATYGVRMVMRKGYGLNESPLFSCRLARRDLTSEFFLIQEHQRRFEQSSTRYEQLVWRVVAVTEANEVDEVFCAIVPDTEAFALYGNILTGNCRKITGGTGYSLHAYDPGESFTFWSGVRINSAIATDVNSLANPYGPRLVTDMPREMINDILAIRTIDGLQVFKWGGYYSKNKDAMHFEIQVSPEELARGIDWSTVRGSSEEAELDKEERRRLDAAYNALFVWRSYPGKPAERYEHMNILEAQNKGIIAALNKLLPPEDQIELDEIGLPKN